MLKAKKKKKKKKTRKLVRPNLPIANEQFALMVEFMDNNCSDPKGEVLHSMESQIA